MWPLIFMARLPMFFRKTLFALAIVSVAALTLSTSILAAGKITQNLNILQNPASGEKLIQAAEVTQEGQGQIPISNTPTPSKIAALSQVAKSQIAKSSNQSSLQNPSPTPNRAVSPTSRPLSTFSPTLPPPTPTTVITPPPTSTPPPANNTNRCIITLFGQQYDVTSLRSTHSGGNVFQCGTDMTTTYQRKHGNSVSMMQPYLVTNSTGTTPPPTPSPTNQNKDKNEDEYEDD